MDFAIPRKNNSKMLLYIWKIIDLPFISYQDLFFLISFKIFLFPPDKAVDFLRICIENKFLVEEENQYLKLSEELHTELENWQKKRRIEILKKIEYAKKVETLKKDLYRKDTSKFSVLINAFVDKGTLNRSVSVSDASFEILKYDQEKGILNSKVKGSKEDFYIIKIDTNKKILQHNCHDYTSRRAENKKFCKHIAKLFLLLKEREEQVADYFLKKLAEDIDMWDFSV
jgi:hypothetical protein